MRRTSPSRLTPVEDKRRATTASVCARELPPACHPSHGRRTSRLPRPGRSGRIGPVSRQTTQGLRTQASRWALPGSNQCAGVGAQAGLNTGRWLLDRLLLLVGAVAQTTRLGETPNALPSCPGVARRPQSRTVARKPRGSSPRVGQSAAGSGGHAHTRVAVGARSASRWRNEQRLHSTTALCGSLRRKRECGYGCRRCRFCLIAAATVLGLASIGSSHAPTWCLCTGSSASGQLALPLVVPERQPSGSVPGRPHPVEERQRCPVRRSPNGHEILGWPEPAPIRGRVFSAWSRTWSGARRRETSGSPPGSGSPSCPGP